MKVESSFGSREMIPRSRLPWEAGDWHRLLAEAVSDPAELAAMLDLPPETVTPAVEASQDFALRVPRGFVARMRTGDPSDPLLRQVLPVGEEFLPAPGTSLDPLEEDRFSPVPGVLHKYHGRALIVAAGGCAVNCRYCFRRHFPYSDQRPGADWQGALDYIASRPSIEEVILSGGDPLLLPDESLAPRIAAFDRIPHVRRIRVHTRVPIVLPERVDPALLDWIQGGAARRVVVVHANHPREIDRSVAAALAALGGAGATVLNQAVLLAGVNDESATLAELSETLFESGVLPYYLHLLDPVVGAAHFDVPRERAVELMRELSGRLPGYLMPRLVREEPGGVAKTTIDWERDHEST